MIDLDQRSTIGRRAAPARTTPFISVIVPVRNEAAVLGDTLRLLLSQRYDADRFEVLVADGASTDGTRKVVRRLQQRFPNLVLVDNPKRWSSAGRNAALRAARGEIILLVDGHCDIDSPDYLEEVAEAFARSGADCLGRPQPLDVPGATPLQKAIGLARSSWLGHHPDSHIYSGREGFVPPQSVAVAYRREVFDAVGPFDERFDACEDVELNQRVAQAGLHCYFTPRIAVRYHPRGRLRRLFRQMVRYGRGRVRLLRKHPRTFSLKSLAPALLLLGLVCGPVLSLIWPALWLVYGAAVGLYAAAVLSCSYGLAREHGWGLLPLLPPVFLAIHGGAGCGSLLELFAGAAGPNDGAPADR
jgi:glycosyltransferase involved in cell wall biosynthesis